MGEGDPPGTVHAHGPGSPSFALELVEPQTWTVQIIKGLSGIECGKDDGDPPALISPDTFRFARLVELSQSLVFESDDHALM